MVNTIEISFSSCDIMDLNIPLELMMLDNALVFRER